MAFEWSTAVSFVRRQSGPAALAMAVVAGVYVLVPRVGALGPPEWRPYMLGAFLLSSVVALMRGIDWTATQVTIAFKHKREREKLLSLIRNLSPEAKGLLKRLLSEETLVMDMRNASVGVLSAMELTFRPNLSYPGTSFSYTLQPDTRRLLNEHPEVLDGAVTEADGRRTSRGGRG